MYSFSQRRDFKIHSSKDLKDYTETRLNVDDIYLGKFEKGVMRFIEANYNKKATVSTSTKLAALEERLLSLGGNKFMSPKGDIEEDTENIINRGLLWLPIGLKK